jgi:hypothetical protein
MNKLLKKDVIVYDRNCSGATSSETVRCVVHCDMTQVLKYTVSAIPTQLL